MIPLSLQLKNFLSYGSSLQEIDFSAYHLICLTGKNGHGKSALLDAITWALWGQARKVLCAVKADDNLIRLGQTHMMVLFTFICNGNQYTVKREYSKTHGKATTTLEFGLFEAESGKYISLTDKTIKQTQQRIEETIRFSFESFVNSVFLRQSNANEFSKKSPKDRKEILATILGLDHYESMRRLALEKMRQVNTTRQAISTLYEKQQKELELLSDTPKKLEETQNALSALEKRYHLWKTKKESISKQRALLTEYQKEEKNQQQLISQLQSLVNLWRSSRKKCHTNLSRTDLEKEQARIIACIDTQQQLLLKNLELKQTVLTLKTEINTQSQIHAQRQLTALKEAELALDRLRIEKESITQISNSVVEELQKTEQSISSGNNLVNTLQTKHAELEKQMIPAASLVKQEQQLEKGKSTYQQWVAQYNLMHAQFQQLQHKKQLQTNDQDPSCPLCEQNLSLSRRRFLLKKMSHEEVRTTHQISRFKQIIPKLKEQLVALHEHITQTKKKEQDAVAIQEAIQQQQAHLNFCIEQKNKYTAHQNELFIRTAALENLIETQSLALSIMHSSKEISLDPSLQSLYQQVSRIELEIMACAYDEQIHKKAEKERILIQQQLHEHDQIQVMITTQKERAHAIHLMCNQIKESKKIVAQLRSECSLYTDGKNLFREIEHEELSLAQEYESIAQLRQELFQIKGTLQARQQTWIEKSQENKAYEKQMLEQQIIAQDYQTIAQALSKDGIQALLIEDAIPEIEQEANNLLSRLTDNQAQLFIESVKDLKKGGTKETLDITIADQAGIRPYELFSGGEAFRIDFALRIAISKLLARRAGATLQTLIIDEGFGSQDEEGLSHIMDVIHAIQHDFSKIIIISHLPILKDQFPVHFVVEKRPQGSTVQVIQQG